MKRMAPIRAIGALLALAGCATPQVADPGYAFIDLSRLAPANTSLAIPGLGPCTDNPDRSLHLASDQPLTVLVHGGSASAGRLRALAQVLAFHGQQSACFSYDDRERLTLSSAKLSGALGRLAQAMANRRIAVIGHSQGALIARRALVGDAIHASDLRLRLVTVSGPFGGVAAASMCGDRVWRALSFGLVVPICQIVTGAKWSDITSTSPFIVAPGRLGGQVQDYLKVVTNERGSCRRMDSGGCAEPDTVFSLDEQRNAVVDRDPIVTIVEVKAGHVEIVGDQRVAPAKLIALLQQHGIILPTTPERMEQLGQLLAALYGAPD